MWKICFIFHKQHLFQELGSRSYILHTKEKGTEKELCDLFDHFEHHKCAFSVLCYGLESK